MVHDAQSHDNAGTEQTPSTPPPPADSSTPNAPGSERQKKRSLLDKSAATVDRVKTGTLATMWSHLNAVDFMNSAFQFSALIILCLFPFLVVIQAATGGNVTHTIIIRLGLNAQAAKDVEGLITSGTQSVQSLTVVGAIILVLFAVAIPGTLQLWYERLYDETPRPGWTRQLAIRLIWVIGLLAYLWLQVLVGSQVGPAGGHVIIFGLEIVIATLFWWWSMHFLLLGRRSWRLLFPGAVATALCITGLAVVSSLRFSQSIISDDNSYGPVGVVMVLLEYCIGFGVCIHLGAVVGRMWSQRQGRELSPP